MTLPTDAVPELSVIMPAFNEGARVAASLAATAEALASFDYEIILVDDGSADDTAPKAAAAAAVNNRIRVVRLDVNAGKGHALRIGFESARGQLVAFLDSDLDILPREILSLLRVMERTDADIVVGSKWHPESETSTTPLRKIVSHAYRVWVDLLFKLPVRETQTGIKLFKRAALEKAFPRTQTNRFGHDLELLVAAHRSGFRIVDAPIVVTLRSTKMRLARASFDVWLDTLRVYYRASFWRWMEPAWHTKLAMVVFVVGIAAASAGASGMLMTMKVPAGFNAVVHYGALQFLDRNLRNWTLIVSGIMLVCGAVIYLNRVLMNAFARLDSGDLAGLARVRRISPPPPAAEPRLEKRRVDDSVNSGTA